MVDASEELIADFKEAFSLFDKDGDNKIKTSELGLLVRSLNQNPTEAELEEMKAEIDPEDTGELTFSDFVALILRRWKDVDAEEELLEAFKVLTKGNPRFITSGELKHMVSMFGEKFTEEEADLLIKRANPNAQGEIDYEELVRLLTTKFA